MGKTLVMDLDGTLCEQTSLGNYHRAKPKLDMIAKVNEYYDAGWKIHVNTARGMSTYSGNVLLVDALLRPLTVEWLRENGVKYHYLSFGKPAGERYVDDRGCGIDEFLSSDP